MYCLRWSPLQQQGTVEALPACLNSCTKAALTNSTETHKTTNGYIRTAQVDCSDAALMMAEVNAHRWQSKCSEN
jgi:hypothetical protein